MKYFYLNPLLAVPALSPNGGEFILVRPIPENKVLLWLEEYGRRPGGVAPVLAVLGDTPSLRATPLARGELLLTQYPTAEGITRLCWVR